MRARLGFSQKNRKRSSTAPLLVRVLRFATPDHPITVRASHSSGWIPLGKLIAANVSKRKLKAAIRKGVCDGMASLAARYFNESPNVTKTPTH